MVPQWDTDGRCVVPSWLCRAAVEHDGVLALPQDATGTYHDSGEGAAMRRFGSVDRVCSVLAVLAAGAPLFPSCGSPGVCPAVGYGSSVTLHITPERAANLATLV